MNASLKSMADVIAIFSIREPDGRPEVTVISDHCLVAGSLSTAAMLKGTDGAAWLHGLGVRHIAIDVNGKSRGTEPPLTRYN
jgi:thiamine biosynthesis lipoprotein ApbE